MAHITKEPLTPQPTIYPRHFGLIFTQERDWQDLLERAQQQQLFFREETKNRFVGSPLEHRTFFLEDPFYNLMEFKYYTRISHKFEMQRGRGAEGKEQGTLNSPLLPCSPAPLLPCSPAPLHKHRL